MDASANGLSQSQDNPAPPKGTRRFVSPTASSDKAASTNPPANLSDPPFTLRGRILAVFIGLILIIFASIILAFNLLVDSYISSTAGAQLSAVTSRAEQDLANNASDDTSATTPNDNLPDFTQTDRGPFNTRPGAFRMDSNFTALANDSLTSDEIEAANSIVISMRATGRSPDSIVNLALVSATSSYYVSCVPDGSGEYLVVYVDVTGLANFAGSVNARLLQILIAAIAVTFIATFVITTWMTRPLARLTEFARRLGQGDFSPETRTFHDKEIVILADTMNQAARHLDSFDQDQKAFFQNASHELRTPLMAITCQAEGISYGLMDPKDASQKILKETARLTDMVEELLSISRIDSITKDQPLALVDLRQLLDSLIEEQGRQALDQGLTVDVTSDQPSPIILGNSKTLRGAFSNLLSNALRYARHRVVLDARQVGDQTIVTVSDDGPGISGHDLPHIFERFYKGAGGVHGIGLAIVKSVVDQHQGEITVESSDQGCCFRLVFPKL
jgi:signal transduction histidine kinase